MVGLGFQSKFFSASLNIFRPTESHHDCQNIPLAKQSKTYFRLIDLTPIQKVMPAGYVDCCVINILQIWVYHTTALFSLVFRPFACHGRDLFLSFFSPLLIEYFSSPNIFILLRSYSVVHLVIQQ